MTRTFWFQILLVGLGGFVGSSARYLLSGLAHRLSPFTGFPVGTLAVNVIGCAIIGLLGGLGDLRQGLGTSERLFLLIGVLGGFTTFSTFAYETMSLAQDSQFARALANLALQVVVGLAAAWLGYQGARYL